MRCNENGVKDVSNFVLEDLSVASLTGGHCNVGDVMDGKHSPPGNVF